MMLLLGACTWIDDPTFADKLKTLDEDGDGYVASEDCDDGAAAVNPGASESWYDGLDSNCDGLQDYDQDGDGFVPTAYADQAGDLRAGDCDDLDPGVNPLETDSWYDGEDTDCGGNDDYDQDGDGYVTDAYIGLATAGVAGSGALPGGDCDDDTATVSPGEEDDWYDGVDSDCGGEDDFDQDGDGHVRPEDEAAVTRYVDGSGGLPADDCDDQDADVRPGAAETWYDGVDQDCVGGNDWDQDGDGWVPDAYADEAENDLPGGDCDDLDEDVHPGGIEGFGDEADGDCDGDDDGVTLGALDGYTFTSATTPVLVSDDEKLWLSVATKQLRSDTNTWYQAGVAFVWPIDSIRNDQSAFSFQGWNASTTEPSAIITEAHSVALFEGAFYGTLGLKEEDTRKIYIGGYEEDGSPLDPVSSIPDETLSDIDDLSLSLDEDGGLYLAGCAGGQALNWLYIDPSDSRLTDTVVDDLYAATCVLEPQDPETGTILYNDGSNTYEFPYTYDDVNFELVGERSLVRTGSVGDIDSFVAGVRRWRVIASSSLGGVLLEDDTGASYTVGESGDGAIDADADIDAAGQGSVAWINSDGSIRLAIGDMTDAPAYYDVNVDSTSSSPYDTIAVRDLGAQVVVVAAGSDGVGIAIVRPG